MNTQRTAYKFLYGHVCSFLLGMHLGEELLGHMVTLMFNFLRNCQIIFQGTVSLTLPTKSVWMFQFLCTLANTHHHPSSWVQPSLVNVKYYVSMALIAICRVSEDVWHLFMCLLAICMSCLQKCLFRVFCTFKNWVVFLRLSCKHSLRDLDTRPLLDIRFLNIIAHLWVVFSLACFVFWSTKTFNFDEVQSMLPSSACILCVISRKPLPNPR